MLLEANDLHKRFGGVRAVDGVSWSLGAGETRCIIGPNGAGKSTFFKLLVGGIQADSGTIRFADHDITRAHPFERARLGLAVKPQTLGIFGELTVEHNVRLSLQRHLRGELLEKRILAELETVGLAEKAEQVARELSHGEKQWLGLAMAMAADPKLLLLDEPTAGMSPAETQKTAEMIGMVGKRGTSVLVVEHDMAFVRALGVEITVFHDGRLFANGSLSEIENNEEVRRLYLGQRASHKAGH